MHGSSRASEPDMRDIEAVSGRREVLSGRATQRHRLYGKQTPVTAIEQIKETERAMDRLFDTTTVMKRLIALKGETS